MYTALIDGNVELARAQGDWNGTVFFDASGFSITGLALFDCAEGGSPVEIIELPEAVDCPAGCIPVVRSGQLIIGKAVSMSADIKDTLDLAETVYL